MQLAAASGPVLAAHRFPAPGEIVLCNSLGRHIPVCSCFASPGMTVMKGRFKAVWFLLALWRLSMCTDPPCWVIYGTET